MILKWIFLSNKLTYHSFYSKTTHFLKKIITNSLKIRFSSFLPFWKPQFVSIFPPHFEKVHFPSRLQVCAYLKFIYLCPLPLFLQGPPFFCKSPSPFFLQVP